MSQETLLQSPDTASRPPEAWAEAGWLPCRLCVELRVPRFTVGDLLRLDVQSIVDTQWEQGTDIPVQVNGAPIGWAEFEAVGERLAVRLTELI